jgi:hypothetical protein
MFYTGFEPFMSFSFFSCLIYDAWCSLFSYIFLYPVDILIYFTIIRHISIDYPLFGSIFHHMHNIAPFSYLITSISPFILLELIFSYFYPIPVFSAPISPHMTLYGRLSPIFYTGFDIFYVKCSFIFMFYDVWCCSLLYFRIFSHIRLII